MPERTSILNRIRQQQFNTQAGRSRAFQLGASTSVGLTGGFGIDARNAPDDSLEVLDQLTQIDEQLGQLPGQTLGGFGGGAFNEFVTNNQQLLSDVRNKTQGATSVLQQLRGGVDPESLGLFNAQDIQNQRQQLLGQRESLLLGPQSSQVDNPLDRLGQTLLGLQAQRGLARGGSAEALRGVGVPQQLQALTATGLGATRNVAQPGQLPALVQQEVQQPGEPDILKFFRNQTQNLFGEIGDISQQAGAFNQFNPPPFFDLL
jgi:hypothetical protein